ncbi:MAG TPA: iron ABC transporter permease [Rubrivivax sp.]|nr:iron ABC transporter permease [Rubrivivax sp.]
MRALLSLLCVLLALPVLGVLGAWLLLDSAALATLAHQAQTVLPGYVLQTGALAAGVALGVMLLGTACAAAVCLFEFPGRRHFEWALLLPLAMPAYVLAYAWTDALQYSSPLQSALRRWLDVQGPLWPDVRSLWGAVVLFVLCLYPYVYLLTRAALAERGVQMMEVARLLGAPLRRRVLRVALPLARPAIAAGVALALMETLADYGVGAYFGLNTFSTGIYKAWLVMNEPLAGAQLASLLLLLVALLLAVERRAQRRLRFTASRHAHSREARPVPLRGRAAVLAWLLCALPVALGFVLPVLWLLRMLWAEAGGSGFGLPLQRFVPWALSSVRLAALAALAATLLALGLSLALRRGPERGGGVLPWMARIVSLGYALPGAVIAVGILLPLAWAQQRWPAFSLSVWLTGTVLGLMYAYLVRFSAVALQTVESGLARVPRSIDDSARLLGATPRRIFMQLHLPLLRRTALAAALLVFVDVMKELPATLVLRPFGSDTLAVVAYNLARDERLGEAALPSLAIVLVGLLPVVLLSRALRQKEQDR